MTNFEYYKTKDEALAEYGFSHNFNFASTRDINRFTDWLYEEHEAKDELIAQTPIFDLVKAPEVAPGFRPVKIKSPNWVSVIVENKNTFLVVEQLRYGINKKMIEFPCGMVEQTEGSNTAAARELHEETGFIVPKSKFKWIGSVYANPAFMTNLMDYWYVNLNDSDYLIGETKFDEHENLTHFWMPKEKFFNLYGNGKERFQSTFMISALYFYNKHIKKNKNK